MRLTGTELLDWIGLRRVTEGGVALHGSDYVHWGRKVPCYLPEVFGRLVEAELIDLLDANREGLRRMAMTPRGLTHYQKLTAKRGLPVGPEAVIRRLLGPPPRPAVVPDCGRSGGLDEEAIR
ncbi:MAG: hypothetical protein ACT4NY_08975 [Pseudonocardiales bacterium]